MAHTNRVKNIGDLAKKTMWKALDPDRWITSEHFLVWIGLDDYASIKNIARIAFRFAMKASPVPAWVFGTLVDGLLEKRNRASLERHWNIRPGSVRKATIGRLSCKEPNLRVDTKRSVTDDTNHE